MGAVKRAIDSSMYHAGWPVEGMEVAMLVLEQVGSSDFADELCDRAERACDGWQSCLIAASEGRGELCDPCPLTTVRDLDSEACES